MRKFNDNKKVINFEGARNLLNFHQKCMDDFEYSKKYINKWSVVFRWQISNKKLYERKTNDFEGNKQKRKN